MVHQASHPSGVGRLVPYLSGRIAALARYIGRPPRVIVKARYAFDHLKRYLMKSNAWRIPQGLINAESFILYPLWFSYIQKKLWFLIFGEIAGNIVAMRHSVYDQPEDDKTKLGTCDVARVRYPDDTALLMGVPMVEFVNMNYVAKENCGWTRVFVTRRGNKHHGDNVVHYETTDITAQANHDYTPIRDGRLVFKGQEYEKYIDIEIIDDKHDEKDETFNIELTSYLELWETKEAVSVGERDIRNHSAAFSALQWM
uniref:Calx-beta domain-containing protein n=1 Tax=Angiostrongylus cantonensis TaxID=6313 RepID=A0A0K0DRW1_ANGCA